MVLFVKDDFILLFVRFLLLLFFVLLMQDLLLFRDRWSFASQEINAKGLRADDWVKSVSELLGGKCGGKEASAQGSGPNIENVDKALETAKQFAQMKLGN